MGKKEVESGECQPEVQPARLIFDHIPSVVNQLVQGFTSKKWSSHIEPVPIPSKKEVVDLVQEAQQILFPGYFSSMMLSPASLEYHLGEKVTIARRSPERQSLIPAVPRLPVQPLRQRLKRRWWSTNYSESPCHCLAIG